MKISTSYVCISFPCWQRETPFCTSTEINQDGLFKYSSHAALLIMYVQYRQDNLDVEKNNSPQPITSWWKPVLSLKGVRGMILVSLFLPKDHLISVLFLFPRNTRYSLPKGSKIGRREKRDAAEAKCSWWFWKKEASFVVLGIRSADGRRWRVFAWWVGVAQRWSELQRKNGA